MIFVDTAAFYALDDAADPNHGKASAAFGRFVEAQESLITSNYVELETCALVQRRLGMRAVATFYEILEVCRVVHVDETQHARAVACLSNANRRKLSLVDCSSFEVMRDLGITGAFSFDKHFAEFGFTLV